MGKRTNEFQQFVTYIYSKISAPFKVTESAMVPEDGTGTKREIDILLEGSVAGLDVKIGIECRDRSRGETIEWIDGLIGKYARLKMNKIVAVSSQGFSKEAEVKAAQHGIELLTTKEAEEVDWAKEIMKPYFDVMTHQNEILFVSTYNAQGKEISSTNIDPETHKAVHRDHLSEAVYPAIQAIFLKFHASRADAEINRLLESNWQKFFRDPTPRYCELNIDKAGIQLQSEKGDIIQVEKMVYGVGTRFYFHKSPAKSTVSRRAYAY